MKINITDKYIQLIRHMVDIQGLNPIYYTLFENFKINENKIHITDFFDAEPFESRYPNMVEFAREGNVLMRRSPYFR